MSNINVTLFQRSDSGKWYMQYRDPETGAKRRKKTGTHRRSEAERIAARWEQDIREGKDDRYGNIPWDVFRERYELNYLNGKAESTITKTISILDSFERFAKPSKLRYVTPEKIAKYVQHLRERNLSESTIAGHLRHLKAALNWGRKQRLLNEVPDMSGLVKGRRSKVMKGRPITGEEFERILAAVEKVILEPNTGGSKRKRKPDWNRIASWKFFLAGLWYSGLRLSEALELSWDDPNRIHIEMVSGKVPMFRIPEGTDKRGDEQLVPTAPEFEDLLGTIPKARRRGFVFNPEPQKGKVGRLKTNAVCKRLKEIGEAAGVKVSTRNGKPIYAGAHDLRRSFGARWAERVMPFKLKELMRHSSVEVTERYYVGQNAHRTSQQIREGYSGIDLGTILGTGQPEAPEEGQKTPQKQ